MARIRIYDSPIEISDQDKEKVKKVMLNHLIIYNNSLEGLRKNPELTFEDVKRLSSNYIAEKGIHPVINGPMLNELYYQYKKFNRNLKIKKELTDIHYLTFIASSKRNGDLNISEDGSYLEIPSIGVRLDFYERFPVLNDDGLYYINLSYSTISDGLTINVFHYTND